MSRKDGPGKRLERVARRLGIRLLVRLAPRGPARAPDWSAAPHRVLFLRHDRIGDMLLTTGVLRAIGESHPTVTLDVLASPVNAPVLEQAPWIGTVHRFRRGLGHYRRLLATLRRARYDAVVDCMVTAPSFTTLALMVASGARWRIGIGGRGPVDAVVNVPVPFRAGDGHMVQLLAQLAIPFGVDPARADVHPVVVLSADERARAEARWRAGDGPTTSGRLLVNVSAGKAFRMWPDERFVAVLRRARERDPGLAVLVIGAPDEQERAASIASAGGARHADTPSLRDALALVERSDLVFTPDTSIAHAATAFRRPAVVLYRGDTAIRWGRFDAPGEDVSTPRHELATLPLERALAALDRLLDGPRAVRRPA